MVALGLETFHSLPEIPGEPLADVPFEDAAREFLAYQRVYLRAPRHLDYVFSVLGRTFAGRMLAEVDVRAIETFVGERFAAGIGRATLNRYRSGLSGLFTWAIARGYHPGPNPIRSVRKFRESPGRTRYLTPQEADRLVLAASAHLKPILVTALHTGGRISEVLGLLWGDVDLEAGVVTFRRETTKNARPRSVPMSPELHAAISALRRGRRDEPLFTWNDAPLKRVRRLFARACRKAGLRDFRVHDCRHTFASWFVMNGGDIYVLKEYLGHSTVVLTQRYSHLSPDHLKRSVRFIGPPRRQQADEERGS